METMKFSKQMKTPKEQFIPKILSEMQLTRDNLISLYGRYKGTESSIPIFSRRLQLENEQEWKNLINYKSNHDFFGLIIDDFVGFLVGNPCTYFLDYQGYQDQDLHMAHNALLQEWIRENALADEDVELVKHFGICGSAFRLQYYVKDEPKKLRFLLLGGWEVILLHSGNSLAPDAALRLFDDGEGNIIRVDWYDGQTCEEWIYSKTEDKAEWVKTGDYLHMLGRVPITEYQNNRERLGDCTKALSLIDAYNILMSDSLSELQQFRLAYMALIGGKGMDDADVEDFIRHLVGVGVIEIPEGGDVKFITKNLNIDALKYMAQVLEENIYRFCKATNYASEKIGGGATAGVTLQQRTTPTRNACAVKQNKKDRGDRRFFGILFDYWRDKGIADIDVNDLRIQYTPNYPVNLLEEAQVQQALDGKIPTRDRLALFSRVTDPDDTEERLLEERKTVFGSPWEDPEGVDLMPDQKQEA